MFYNWTVVNSSIMEEQTLLFYLSILMIVSGVGAALVLLLGIQAMYGRYTVASKLAIPSRLAWFLQEAPSFFLAVYYLTRSSGVGTIVIGLFAFHYFVRTFLFPLLMRTDKSTPWYIFISAVFFCTWNGYLQGAYHANYAVLNPITDPLSVVGIIVFFAGFLINQHSDHILRNLRKPGETGYKIPRGGLFEYVSGANFFGEVVEWVGYALFARTLPALAFAIFTACNIGPRALQHHNWYLTKFNDYPKDRKAFIPFII